MARPHGSRGTTVVFAVVAGLAFCPGIARGHTLTGSRFDAPLPLSLLFIGAGVTVAITAIWLGLTRHTPSPTTWRRHLVTVPAPAARVLRRSLPPVFITIVVGAIAHGIFGPQVLGENLVTVFTWPVWFRGLALVAIVFGSPWRLLSPWRTIYAGLARLEGRPVALLGGYPEGLGAWPAVIGFIVLIGIVENLTVIPRSPAMTTVVVAGYALVTIVGAVFFGSTWLRQGDPLSPFFELFGRVASIDVVRGDDGAYAVGVRPPWEGCLRPVGGLSLVVFVIAMVYTVSFDGFTNTRAYQRLLFSARDALGTGPATGILVYGIGLGGFVGTFALISWLADRLGGKPSGNWVAGMRSLAPSVLPIAAAYEIAHNYPYVLRNGGHAIDIILGPFVDSLDPLWWMSLPTFWASQIILILLGHVIAVIAAHYIAVSRYDTPAATRRAHTPLVLLMIGYTVLSLWIVSAPVVA